MTEKITTIPKVQQSSFRLNLNGLGNAEIGKPHSARIGQELEAGPRKKAGPVVQSARQDSGRAPILASRQKAQSERNVNSVKSLQQQKENGSNKKSILTFGNGKDFSLATLSPRRGSSFGSMQHPFEKVTSNTKMKKPGTGKIKPPKLGISNGNSERKLILPKRPTEKGHSRTSGLVSGGRSERLIKQTSSRTTIDHESDASSEPKKATLSGSETLAACPDLLADYEHQEVKQYDEIYFIGTQSSKLCRIGSKGFDDNRGDYCWNKGEHLAYRYEIIGVLGKGSFGQVLECKDHKTNTLLAVKMIRNKKKFHKQAVVERKVLEKLKASDPKQMQKIIQHVECFMFRDHLCLTFQKLSMNLYEVIKTNQYRGFDLAQIQAIGKQLMTALKHLRRVGIIHCDMKPENILMEYGPVVEKPTTTIPPDTVMIPLKNGSQIPAMIKVIDFGSSCLLGEQVFTYIQSRFYRAPEVILGLPYGLEIDMWSVGCILAELYIGFPIFPGENEGDQLSCMMEILGMPTESLLRKSKRQSVFFSNSTGFPRPCKNSRGIVRSPNSKTLEAALGCADTDFLGLLENCFTFDPATRITPDNAMYHSFFKQSYCQ